MANILYPPPRAQSVGELLDSTFRIFGATLIKCLPYSIVAVIVGQLPALYQVARSGRPLQRATALLFFHDRLWLLLYVVAVLGTLLLTNAVILRQHAIITGGRTSAAGELARAARHVPGAVLIYLLLGLAILVTMIPVLIVVGVVLGPMGAGLGPSGAMVGAFLITLLLVLICASWAVIRWVVAVGVYVLSERGPVASMSHSWSLTSGSFWRLSIVYAVAVVVLIVLYAVGAVVGSLVTAVLARGDFAVMSAVLTSVMVLLGAIAAPFYSGLMLAVLGDLSVRREGADIAQRIAAAAE
jgi:hypothetical protein